MLKGINGFNASEVLDVERQTSGSWMTTISLGFTVLVLTTGCASPSLDPLWLPSRSPLDCDLRCADA